MTAQAMAMKPSSPFQPAGGRTFWADANDSAARPASRVWTSVTRPPAAETARYAKGAPGGRSASQIFPATLGWMGYDRASVAARYDRDLDGPTARYVWFGRNVIPVRDGDAIGVSAGPDFPGTAAR